MYHPCSSFVTGYSSTFGAAGVWIASHINPTAQKSCKVAIFICIYGIICVITITLSVIYCEYCNNPYLAFFCDDGYCNCIQIMDS
jgi:hypothetical protein